MPVAGRRDGPIIPGHPTRDAYACRVALRAALCRSTRSLRNPEVTLACPKGEHMAAAVTTCCELVMKLCVQDAVHSPCWLAGHVRVHRIRVIASIYAARCPSIRIHAQ